MRNFLISTHMRSFLLAAVATVGLMAPANAITVGSEPLGSALNDIIGPATGYFGANLFATGPLTITYTYLGKEAGFTNGFFVNGTGAGNQVFNTATTSAGATFTTAAPLGLLSFALQSNQPGGAFVVNGSNPDIPTTLPNFFASFYAADGVTLGAFGVGTSGVIAFDDGGAGPDRDYDDLVVKFQVRGGTITTVP